MTSEQYNTGSSDERNVAEWERTLSLGAGIFSILRAVQYPGALTAPLLVLGGALLDRGLQAKCDAYSALGINTRHRDQQPMEVRRSIEINCDPEVVYQFWRDLENLPRAMDHLIRVEEKSQTRSHWVARGPLGVQVEWDSEIIEDIPNRLLAWQSVEGSDIETTGRVEFRATRPGWTEVDVHVSYKHPAGRLGSTMAHAIGEDPDLKIKDDLRRIKHLLERERASATLLENP